MRRTCLFFVIVLAILLADTRTLAAQTVTNTSVTVSARVVGRFELTLNTEGFDFGNLDAGGINVSSPYVAAKGRNGGNVGEIYENVAGSILWTGRATPSSTVTLALVSTVADHTGGMYADDLEVRLPPIGDGTSMGYQPFSSGANLLTGLSLGAGVNAVTGPMDLRLTVLDDDPAGINTWTIRLRATANP